MNQYTNREILALVKLLEGKTLIDRCKLVEAFINNKVQKAVYKNDK